MSSIAIAASQWQLRCVALQSAAVGLPQRQPAAWGALEPRGQHWVPGAVCAGGGAAWPGAPCWVLPPCTTYLGAEQVLPCGSSPYLVVLHSRWHPCFTPLILSVHPWVLTGCCWPGGPHGVSVGEGRARTEPTPTWGAGEGHRPMPGVSAKLLSRTPGAIAWVWGLGAAS